MSNPSERAIRSLSNDHIRIEVLASAGPRIVGLYAAGSEDNLFASVPNIRIPTPNGEFAPHGGHRLWHAPEAFPRSYIPDSDGLEISEVAGELLLAGPVEPVTGIRKRLEIVLAPSRPTVTVRHFLENQGPWPVELAIWALTMVRLGGLAILPQTAHRLDADGLLPNRNLALWPYTRLSDPRLQLHDDFVLVEAHPGMPPCKLGYMNRHGWLGYLYEDAFFAKRFEPQPDKPHADLGCNTECYCEDRFMEIESLGPLTRLEPGEVVTHVEHWELHRVPRTAHTADGVRGLVASLNLPFG